MGKIYKPAHGSIEWLRLRHRTEEGEFVIAASEAAAVHGEHRFKTMLQLFTEKRAPEPELTETNAAMERGNRLEPVIRDWAADMLGVRLVEPRFMWMIEPSSGAMVATLDAVDEYSYEQGAEYPSLVVEIKTYNREWDGVLPRYWYWQGVQQAACAHVKQITWAIFDASLRLHLYVQEVTQDEINQHAGAVQDFMFWLKLGEPNPEWPVSYDEIAAVYPDATDKIVDITDNAHLLAELRDVQFQKKELTAIEDELKGRIASLLGSADTGTVNGDVAVTWKQQKRSSFDGKGLMKTHPDLYDEFTKISTYRVLRMKGEK
jgi:hypothetical protein